MIYTTLRIKDCDKVIRLSAKEVANLQNALALYKGQDIEIGEFGCAIGTGYLIANGTHTVDITDYESW